MPKNSNPLNIPSQFKKYFPEPVGNSEKIEDLPAQNINPQIKELPKLKPNEAYCRECKQLSTFPFIVHREWKAPVCKFCWNSNKIGPINFPVGTKSTKLKDIYPQVMKLLVITKPLSQKFNGRHGKN